MKGISVNLTAFDKYIISCIHPHNTTQNRFAIINISWVPPVRFSTPRAPGTAGYHCNFMQSALTALKVFCTPFIHISPPHTLVNDNLFIMSIVLSFPKYHLIGITQFVAVLERRSFFTRQYATKFPTCILWLESSFVLCCILFHCSGITYLIEPVTF